MSWDNEHPALQIGVGATLLVLLTLLWRVGFRYHDVGWSLVGAAAFCVVQGLLYARHQFRDAGLEDRLESVGNFVMAVATVMFVASFLRVARRRTTDLAAFGAIVLFAGVVFALDDGPFLEWQLLSRAQATLLALALPVLLVATRRRAPAGLGTHRQRRLRLVRALGWATTAACAGQAALERTLGWSIGPLVQLATLGAVTLFLLQDLLVSQRLYADERRLRVEREAEAARSRAVARIAQLVAHDVRRPFRIVRLLGRMLGEARTPAEASAGLARAAALVDRAEAHILGMLDDVLATHEPARPPAAEPPVPLAELVAEAVAHVGLALETPCRIALRYELADARTFVGHRARLVRIVQNLVENAARAMPPEGTITIRTAPGATPGEMRLTIHNTGSVLPRAVLERLGEVEATGSGSGYGLAAVRAIAESYGGRLEAASDPAGTSFHVTAPAAPPPVAASTVALPTELTGADLFGAAGATATSPPLVAVVDDDPFSEFAWRQLGGAAAADFYRSPEALLTALGEAPAKRAAYRVLLVDHHFKGSAANGLQLAQALLDAGIDVPVVLWTDARIALDAAPRNVVAVRGKEILAWPQLAALIAPARSA
jgi:signal transduction histidine kinase